MKIYHPIYQLKEMIMVQKNKKKTFLIRHWCVNSSPSILNYLTHQQFYNKEKKQQTFSHSTHYPQYHQV